MDKRLSLALILSALWCHEKGQKEERKGINGLILYSLVTSSCLILSCIKSEIEMLSSIYNIVT